MDKLTFSNELKRIDKTKANQQNEVKVFEEGNNNLENENTVPVEDKNSRKRDQEEELGDELDDADKNEPSKYKAYQQFCKLERPKVKKELPNLTAPEIKKELGKRWQEYEKQKKEE